MGKEQYTSIASEFRQEAMRLEHRLLFFAALLCFAHFVTIEPGDVEVVGLRLSISNPSHIRGIIALAFFYFLHMWLLYVYQSHYLARADTNRAIARALILKIRQKSRRLRNRLSSQKYVAYTKLRVRLHFAIIAFLVVPWTVAILCLVLSALYLGFFDIVDLFGDLMVQIEIADQVA